MQKDIIYKVALGLVPKIGAITAKKLISHFETAEAVFKARQSDLEKISRIGTLLARQIKDAQVLKRAEKECTAALKNGIRMLSVDNPAYPDRLRHNRDSPLVLFIKGEPDLNAQRMVAIVGTRKPSHQGISNCERIVEELARYQATIISGMAFGIDACAHRAALNHQLPTWGVIAHGHAYLYPAAHRKMANQILEQGGALLSEYSFFTKAEKEFFPMRNRIVAGLCDALIVIETAKRGGSMITAQLANQYYRDVFAFPGRVNDPLSKGCNLLIKGHQAALLESANDLAYVLRWTTPKDPQGVQQELFLELSEEEKNIVDLLRQSESLGIDDLTNKFDTDSGQIKTMLLNLEFKNLIKSLPGNRYTLL